MTNDKQQDTSIFEILSLDQIEAMGDHPAGTLVSDPSHRTMFAINVVADELSVWWGGYDYTVPLGALGTPEGVLFYLHHVLGKDWEHATQARVVELIEALAWQFSWELYKPLSRAPAPGKRTTSDAAERAKLTPKLRYDVLTRDNFRCRACGASPESGAHLHIDHVLAISNGGLTVFENLQALCSPCNYGKGARS